MIVENDDLMQSNVFASFYQHDLEREGIPGGATHVTKEAETTLEEMVRRDFSEMFRKIDDPITEQSNLYLRRARIAIVALELIDYGPFVALTLLHDSSFLKGFRWPSERLSVSFP